VTKPGSKCADESLTRIAKGKTDAFQARQSPCKHIKSHDPSRLNAEPRVGAYRNERDARRNQSARGSGAHGVGANEKRRIGAVSCQESARIEGKDHAEAALSIIAEILDRSSGVAVLKERLSETNRNAERGLAWLLDHEKRLIQLEATRQVASTATPPRLPRM
jgi:hypothetical protein